MEFIGNNWQLRCQWEWGRQCLSPASRSTQLLMLWMGFSWLLIVCWLANRVSVSLKSLTSHRFDQNVRSSRTLAHPSKIVLIVLLWLSFSPLGWNSGYDKSTCAVCAHIMFIAIFYCIGCLEWAIFLSLSPNKQCNKNSNVTATTRGERSERAEDDKIKYIPYLQYHYAKGPSYDHIYKYMTFCTVNKIPNIKWKNIKMMERKSTQ